MREDMETSADRVEVIERVHIERREKWAGSAAMWGVEPMLGVEPMWG